LLQRHHPNPSDVNAFSGKLARQCTHHGAPTPPEMPVAGITDSEIDSFHDFVAQEVRGDDVM
jgi:hypothetical protein